MIEKKEKYLIVIDVQNDFIDGVLGTDEARKIVPKVIEKIKNFDGKIIFTRDTHYDNYLETQEGKLLPIIHCIKNTKGWEYPTSLNEIQKEKNIEIFEKNSFASLELAKNIFEKAKNNEVLSIELIGICTDICVINNALLLKAYMPEVSIYVDKECCAGTTIENHNKALDIMKSCQILVK